MDYADESEEEETNIEDRSTLSPPSSPIQPRPGWASSPNTRKAAAERLQGRNAQVPINLCTPEPSPFKLKLAPAGASAQAGTLGVAPPMPRAVLALGVLQFWMHWHVRGLVS